MGKTPGKWIKNLLGKKSTKSSSLKKGEILKPGDKGEALVSVNEPLPELPTEIPVFSLPVPDISSRNVVDSEKEIATTLENPEIPLCSAKEGGDAQSTVNLATLDDSQKTSHELAATQAQAAFRGYLARRAFRTLKGIVKLQALIRGHLVRRQAVATFSCVWGIVKLQALARGQKVRRSNIGTEAHKIYSQGKLLDAKHASTSGLSLSTRAKKLRKNAYIQKVLATSPAAMPLRLRYGPGESNNADEWLERWTKSHFWQPLRQPKKKNGIKSQTNRTGMRTKDTDQSRPKRSIRKPSNASVENGTNQSESSSEKRKRSIVKKVSGHATNPVPEHPSTEKDKVKRNLRKSPDSMKVVSKKSEVDNGKTKLKLRKASSSPTPNITVQGNVIVTTNPPEDMNDLVVASKQSDLETSLNLPAADSSVDELHDQSVVDEQPVEENGKTEIIQEQSVADEKPVEQNGETESFQESDKELNSKDGLINNENLKNSQRRASLPGNIDQQENNGSHSTPKLPSYMAPTASAKARLRGQGSPRFSLEGVEKNSTTRRLSLPSSNGKLTTPSPRAHKLLQATGKGVVRSDKSLTSSRDGSNKNSWT